MPTGIKRLKKIYAQKVGLQSEAYRSVPAVPVRRGRQVDQVFQAVADHQAAAVRPAAGRVNKIRSDTFQEQNKRRVGRFSEMSRHPFEKKEKRVGQLFQNRYKSRQKRR